MRKKIIIGVAVGVALLGGLWALRQAGKSPDASRVQGGGAGATQGVAVEASNNVASGSAGSSATNLKQKGQGVVLMSTNDAAYITKTLEGFLDDDNFEGVLREAARLKKHPDAEVRSAVANALQWTGVKGLGELTTMLGDPDPDVASEVMDNWKMSLAEVEASADRAALLTAAAAMLGPNIDSDTLDGLLSDFMMLDENDAVPSLVELLSQTEDPEAIRAIIDTLDPIINSDQTLETKEDVDRAVSIWAQEQMDKEPE